MGKANGAQQSPKINRKAMIRTIAGNRLRDASDRINSDFRERR